MQSQELDREDDAGEEEELDLRTLPDDELVRQMHDDLYDGLKEEIEDGTNILLERGWEAKRVLDDALVEGMRIVGIDFRDGILFVPEVLLAANAMKGGMAILRPLLAETGAATIGKVVIGTVKGDIHDIGKNLVGMMLEGAGFEVIDLGINTDADEFLTALDEHQPDILGMSALLTTTMPYMKVVIDTLKERGLRDEYTCWSAGRRSTSSSPKRWAPMRTAATRRSRSKRRRISWHAVTTSEARSLREPSRRPKRPGPIPTGFRTRCPEPRRMSWLSRIRQAVPYPRGSRLREK